MNALIKTSCFFDSTRKVMKSPHIPSGPLMKMSYDLERSDDNASSSINLTHAHASLLSTSLAFLKVDSLP